MQKSLLNLSNQISGLKLFTNLTTKSVMIFFYPATNSSVYASLYNYDLLIV